MAVPEFRSLRFHQLKQPIDGLDIKVGEIVPVNKILDVGGKKMGHAHESVGKYFQGHKVVGIDPNSEALVQPNLLGDMGWLISLI